MRKKPQRPQAGEGWRGISPMPHRILTRDARVRREPLYAGKHSAQVMEVASVTMRSYDLHGQSGMSDLCLM